VESSGLSVLWDVCCCLIVGKKPPNATKNLHFSVYSDIAT